MRRPLSAVLLLTGCALLTTPVPGADDSKGEDGFAPLFNGKDLSGWKMARKGESLDGKTTAAAGRFTMKEGTLVIDPKVKGDLIIETAKTFGGDAHVKFDFRPGPGCNNDLYFRGLKFDLKKPDVKDLKEGEWNAFEIVVRGDEAEFKCNGQSLKTAKAKPAATPLGIRAEFGPVEVRRLRIKAAS